MKEFPECFPDNFVTDILPKGAKEENKSVYRVMKYGTIDREGFISTYEEIQRGLIPRKKRMRLNDPGLYSTSCNIEYSEAAYALRLFMRHYLAPFIAKGLIHGEYGPSQLTSERDRERTDTHVDWWVYDGNEPQMYFSKEEEKYE